SHGECSCAMQTIVCVVIKATSAVIFRSRFLRWDMARTSLRFGVIILLIHLQHRQKCFLRNFYARLFMRSQENSAARRIRVFAMAPALLVHRGRAGASCLPRLLPSE